MAYALCNASGVISFADRVPHDMSLLPIAHGPKRKLVAAISGVGRLAYDNETWLVPGVPEAPDQIKGIDALLAFKKWIKPYFEKQGLKV